jgi:hypothetical protein
MRVAGRIIVLAAVLAVGGLLHAQSSDVKNKAVKDSTTSVKSTDSGPAPARAAASAKKDGKSRPAIAVTPEREAAVLTFVQRNHAELAELLGYLKTSQPEEYERAIREIFRTTERLALVQERDPLQYELEVVSWTAQSRVQLLAAKLKMESNDELLKQLREALKSQNEAKLALLKHERQKAEDRVGKLSSEIARFEKDREKVIDRQLQVLTQAAAEGRTARLGAKNAGKQGKKNANPPEKKPAQ